MSDIGKTITACLLVVFVGAIIIWTIQSTIQDRHDFDARIHQEGLEAGRHDIPLEACPYPLSREEWLKGWIEGKSESNQ